MYVRCADYTYNVGTIVFKLRQLIFVVYYSPLAVFEFSSSPSSRL